MYRYKKFAIPVICYGLADSHSVVVWGSCNKWEDAINVTGLLSDEGSPISFTDKAKHLTKWARKNNVRIAIEERTVILPFP